jgi:hypothetical protein
MRFSVRCEVEADVILPRGLELRRHGRIFELEVESGNLWKTLRVTAPVKYPKRFRWGLEPIPEPRPANAAPFKVHGKFDKDLFDSIIADIQALESTLSLFFPLKRIDWRHPVLNVEFESNDRRDLTWGNLENVRVNSGTPPPVKADENLFVQIAFKGLASHHLATIESFWREGENEVLAGRFINAFYNFYFVLEGLYGNGQWNNDKLESEFKASTELETSIDAYFAARQPQKHIEQVHRMLPEQKKQALPTREILIELIIRTRNRLHHFSNDPKKPHGSPLNHELYEGISMLVRFLAHKGLVKRALEVTGVAGRPAEA